jgi:hypothetical protein
MALVLSGSIDISGSMTATTILISSPGAAGMVSSSAQITELAPLMAYTASLKGASIVSSSQQVQNYFTFAKTGSANTFYSANNFYNPLLISANTGVGTAVPLSLLEVYDGVQSIYKADSGVGTTGAGIWLSHYTLTRANLSGSGIFSLRDNGDSNYHGLAFKIHNTATATDPAVTALSISSGGDVTVSIGNLVMASGKGIDFSATSNGSGTTTSEILSDYEEGTWTPVLKGSTTAGTYTYDTDRTNGKYIKIGNQVNLIGVLRVDAVSSAGTGNALIGGIPFAPTGIDTNWSRVPGILSVQSGPTLPSASLLVYTQSETYSDAIGLGYNGMEGWNQLDVTLVDLPNAMWFFNITYHTI